LAEKILTSKAALEGERKLVTVLFADLKGSMELLADRDPEDARRLLDPVLEHMIDAVHRYEGTVNQVMGDGIMALFGAPLAHEDHAIRACYAALRMQQAVKHYAEGIRRSDGVTIQIRVGLNSGEVVVRSIGSDLHMDYTAVGQTTHLAARMEQLAPPDSVFLTSETLRSAEGYIAVKPLGLVNVKGLNEPIEVFEATGAGSVRTRLQAAEARGLSRFVGRDPEMDQLRRALAQAQAGHGQVVAVVGDPGVGKSRLFYEFIHSHRTQDWRILESASVSYGKATSYLPLVDLLRAYFKITDGDHHRDIQAKVTGAVLTLDRALEPTLVPMLALLDVPTQDAQWATLDPPRRLQCTLDAVKHLLLRESQAQPLLVVFEDLHWIDAETQALLDGLVDSLPAARLFLLVNYRPEYSHGWGSKTYYTRLRLDALLAETASNLLDALVGHDISVNPLKSLLAIRAGGNPLFLEESVRSLVENGVLAGERGAYRLTRAVEAIQVPSTVQAILAARIDRLPSEEKALLQAAAVIGKDVPFVLLQAIAEEAEDQLRAQLAHLQTAEFLYETSLFPNLEYTFKHALTQNVAEATILGRRRRELHLRTAEALATLHPDRQREVAPMLARHYFRAEAWPQACEHATRAAETASAGYANREALDRYDQAIVAAERAGLTPPERMRLYAARARIHGVLSAFEPARTDFETALALAEASGDAAMRAQLLTELGMLWGGHRDYQQGLALAQEAVRIAENADDRLVLAEALVKTGLMELNIARLEDSRRMLERALAIFDETGDERGRAETLDVLSMVAGIEGRCRESGERADRALAAFRGLGDRSPEPSLLTSHGFWMIYGGEQAGETLVRQGLAAAVAIGARSDEAYAHSMLGEAGEIFGAFGPGLAEGLIGLAVAREIGHLEWTVLALSILGRLRRDCDDTYGAVEAHEEMLGIARRLGAVIWIAEALGELGCDRLALGDQVEAALLLDEAISTGGSALKFVLPAMRGRVELLLRRGDAAGALDAARHFQETSREFRIHVVEGQRLEGEALLALGDLDAAEMVVRGAKAEAVMRGLKKATWRTSLMLAEILIARGRPDEAASEREEALAALQTAAAELPDDLRARFLSGPDMRRAQASAGG